MMDLIFRDHNLGTVKTFRVQREHTVLMLHNIVKQAFGFDDNDRFRLFQSKMMEEFSLLSDYDISEGSTLRIIHESPNSANVSDRLKSPKCDFCNTNWAEFYCGDCKHHNLCGECSDFAHKKPANAGHKISIWSMKNQKTICATHHEVCLMFCQQDQVAICHLCVATTHKDHPTMLISDAYPGCVESIRNMQAKVEVSMREVEQMRAKLDLVRTQLLGTPAGATSTPAPPTSGTVFEVRQSIAAHFQQLHDQLNERQAKVERELDEIVQYKDAALKQQRDECEKLLMARRALAGEVQRELAGKSAEWVVANEKQLLHTLAALTSVPAGILDGCVTDSRLEYQRSVTVISQ